MIHLTLALAGLILVLGILAGIAGSEAEDCLEPVILLTAIALIPAMVAWYGYALHDRTDILANKSTISITIPDGEYSDKILASYPVEGQVVAPDFDAAALLLLGEGYERKGRDMAVTPDGATYILAPISRDIGSHDVIWAIARIPENPVPGTKASSVANGTACNRYPGTELPSDITERLEKSLGATVTETDLVTDEINYVKDGKAHAEKFICTPWVIAVSE